MLAVCMWQTDADITEVVIQALGDYVVGRAHIWQWVLEILMQPRNEEIYLTFHSVLIYGLYPFSW